MSGESIDSWGRILRIHHGRAGARHEPGPRTAVVLAGGSGTRLAGYVRDRFGYERPKQFCAFDGRRTLLEHTLERLGQVVAPERTLISLCAEHRELAAPVLRRAGVRAVVQPDNRGTALGLLLPLIEALIGHPGARLLFTPADHGFAHPGPLVATLRQAFQTVEAWSDAVVLVGCEPDRPASDYGWIVPRPGQEVARRIDRFVEKPGLDAARELWAARALWSTMIGVARGRTLLDLFERTHPELVRMALRHAELPPAAREAYLIDAYRELVPVDLSAEVLPFAHELRVLELPRQAGWTDLGTPERLEAWLPEPRSGPRLAHPSRREDAKGVA